MNFKKNIFEFCMKILEFLAIKSRISKAKHYGILEFPKKTPPNPKNLEFLVFFYIFALFWTIKIYHLT